MFKMGSDRWPGISKLAEESGEVIQVIGKLMALDGDNTIHWDGTDLTERLIEEIADLRAAITFVERHNPQLDVVAIDERATMKLKRFEQWRANGQ